jgi:hypothetical protein
MEMGFTRSSRDVNTVEVVLVILRLMYPVYISGN